jgi:hypothetical protein
VLRADGDRQARILQADGQAKAIRTVFDAIHTANPDSKVLAYQYLQALPQIAAGPSNKIWIVPVELTKALEGISGALGGLTLAPPGDTATTAPVAEPEEVTAEAKAMAEEAAAQAARQAAEASAVAAETTGGRPLGLPPSSGMPVSQVLPEEEPEKG